ncbi:MAG: heat-inducible transcriptional repressor HrcA [Bacillota bacterium]|nr:heat-inducible transcriptional repressor HrcA [Bacillota bacterium]
MLTERKKHILRAIVDDYVLNAEPVGSKYLVDKYKLDISSATVRNEMSELEELGYLEKPHTSAGRVPSDKGYRAYIDLLLNLQPVSQTDQEKITGFFNEHMAEVTSLVRQSASVLSEQTDFPSLVISPRFSDTSLEQIKLLMIEPGKALVVVVLSPGIVKDRLIRISPEIQQEDLHLISKVIEQNLSGQKLDQITLIAVSAVAEDVPVPEALLNQVLFEAYVSIKQAENIDLHLEGTHKLLRHPEFQEFSKAQTFMDTLHQEGLVAGYLSEWDSMNSELELTKTDSEDDAEILQTKISKQPYSEENPSYMVRIGQEISLEGLEECSFITATYKITNKITGRIGIVGPKRMEYSKIISQINFINYTLDQQIMELASGYERKEDIDDKEERA